MVGAADTRVNVDSRADSASRSPPRGRAAQPPADTMENFPTDEAQETVGDLGAPSGAPPPPTAHLAIVTTLKGQKEATAGLERQFASLSARVAALDQGAPRPAGDGGVSLDDSVGLSQLAKFAPGLGRPHQGTSHLHSFEAGPAANFRISVNIGLVLLRLEGLRTRSTANKAWQSVAQALPPGTPAPIEVVTLAAHDYITLKYRDRDSGDAAYKAMVEVKLEYFSSKGRAMTAKPIRVTPPPAIRRRGVALRPFYVAVEAACPNVEIVQWRHTACIDADEYMPVVKVLWLDDGSAVAFTEVEIDDSAPKGLAKALRELLP